MAFLETEEHDSIDLSSGGDVLTFEYDGNAPKTVLCRVEVGSGDKPIAGGSNYIVRAAINGKRVSPDSNVQISSGVTETLLQSREIALHSGDTITITVDGESGDTDVYTLATLIDMTPLTSAEVYGSGAVAIDHNYGGDDELRYVTSAGVGIDNAQVQAFLAADYAAGRTGKAFVVGETKTKADGRWLRSMMLDPGDYRLVYFKQGSYGPDYKAVTVAAE